MLILLKNLKTGYQKNNVVSVLMKRLFFQKYVNKLLLKVDKNVRI